MTLFSSRKLCICLWITFSRVLPRELKRDIGWRFSTNVLSSFLWIGETFAFFQMSGTDESESEELNKSVSGSDIASATSLRTQVLIWSGPHAFPVSNDFNRMQTSSFWTIIEDSKVADWGRFGTGLFLSSSYLWSWKYLSKTLAFSVMSLICSPLWFRGGMCAVFVLPMRDLNVLHQSLQEILPDFKFIFKVTFSCLNCSNDIT